MINFLIKIAIQKFICQILCIFLEKWLTFFLKNEILSSESVNIYSTFLEAKVLKKKGKRQDVEVTLTTY